MVTFVRGRGVSVGGFGVFVCVGGGGGIVRGRECVCWRGGWK
jgi:hypothetical protein